MHASAVCMAIARMTAAAGEHNVAAALKDVAARIGAAIQRSGRAEPPRLVAVSKTKPAEMVKAAYEAGHRDFGENYVQELTEKAPQLPDDIRWHYIGHLQSNKAKALLEGVPNLAMVETVDSAKLADKLNTALEGLQRQPLPVMVQVNTSGEESKYGVEPGDALPLCRHVHQDCQNLRFAGLMTIGMADYTSRPENFQTLAALRDEVCRELGMPTKEVELSMGMSGDFEQAVEMGSTNIRVGSTIFGARQYANKQ